MRVLISGGGTGGHLFPAIAVAQALSRKDPEGDILFVGRQGGIEANIVPGYGFPFESIGSAPLHTDRVWRNWSLPFVLSVALWQARALIRRFKPHVALGTGGYVSAPVVLAAATLGLPIVLQEQNLRPGRATRLLARFARAVAVAYPESAGYLRGRTVVTGTPVRPEFWRPRTDFPDRPRHLLVLGGSQGAHHINQALAEALPQLLDHSDLSIAHQTGDRDLAFMQVVKAGLPMSLQERYQPFGFSRELSEKIRSADLVLSRAGASTLSEVTAIGVPMLLVPGPFAGAHQRLNAGPLERSGAALVIPDEACTGPRLVTELNRITGDPDRYAGMVAASRSLARPTAAEDVIGLLWEVARRE